MRYIANSKVTLILSLLFAAFFAGCAEPNENVDFVAIPNTSKNYNKTYTPQNWTNSQTTIPLLPWGHEPPPEEERQPQQQSSASSAPAPQTSSSPSSSQTQSSSTTSSTSSTPALPPTSNPAEKERVEMNDLRSGEINLTQRIWKYNYALPANIENDGNTTRLNMTVRKDSYVYETNQSIRPMVNGQMWSYSATYAVPGHNVTLVQRLDGPKAISDFDLVKVQSYTLNYTVWQNGKLVFNGMTYDLDGDYKIIRWEMSCKLWANPSQCYQETAEFGIRGQLSPFGICYLCHLINGTKRDPVPVQMAVNWMGSPVMAKRIAYEQGKLLPQIQAMRNLSGSENASHQLLFPGADKDLLDHGVTPQQAIDGLLAMSPEANQTLRENGCVGQFKMDMAQRASSILNGIVYYAARVTFEAVLISANGQQRDWQWYWQKEELNGQESYGLQTDGDVRVSVSCGSISKIDASKRSAMDHVATVEAMPCYKNNPPALFVFRYLPISGIARELSPTYSTFFANGNGAIESASDERWAQIGVKPGCIASGLDNG